MNDRLNNAKRLFKVKKAEWMKDQNDIKNDHNHIRGEQAKVVNWATIIKVHKDIVRRAKSDGTRVKDKKENIEILTYLVEKL